METLVGASSGLESPEVEGGGCAGEGDGGGGDVGVFSFSVASAFWAALRAAAAALP